MGLNELRYAAKVDRKVPAETQSVLHVCQLYILVGDTDNLSRTDGIRMVSASNASNEA